MSARSGSQTPHLDLPISDEIRAFERVLRFLKASRAHQRAVAWSGVRPGPWDAEDVIRERIAVLKTQRDRVPQVIA